MKMIFKIFSAVFLFCFFNLKSAPGCNVVTGLHANAITATSATLNWDTVTCDSFLLRYYITGTNDLRFRIIKPGTSISVLLDSLYPGTGYSWLIHTYCNGGQTGPYQTTPSTFSTLSLNVSCIPPNKLEDSNITTTSATISWNNLVDADSFLIRYNKTGTTDFNWLYVSGSNHTVTLQGLAPSTAYEWSVRSICAGNAIPLCFYKTLATNCDTLPVPDHILICIMENKGYPQIIDSLTIAPYINALANDPMSALFTQSYGLEHPSQPNYLDLFSGYYQGMTNNNKPAAHFTTPNLARQLLDSGKTFVTYSQNLPFTGSDTIRSGDYERKHNPVANWMGTGTNQVPDTCNQPFTNFPSDYNLLPTVSYVVPDQANDMHNGTIHAGDNWIAANIDAYIQWAKSHNSLFILTFDEDNHAYNNRIVTIFTGPMVRGGVYSKYMNHYSVLRTIQDMYNIGQAGHSGEVESVKECWLASTNDIETEDSPVRDWIVYGFGGTGELNVDYTLNSSADVTVRVFTLEGKLVHIQDYGREQAGIHRTIISCDKNSTAVGLYIVQLTVNQTAFSKKVLVVY